MLHFAGTVVGPWLLRQVREHFGAEIDRLGAALERFGAEVAISVLALVVVLLGALAVRGAARYLSQWGWTVLWLVAHGLYLGGSVYVGFDPTRDFLHSLLANVTLPPLPVDGGA